jgi:hypothetical protein
MKSINNYNFSKISANMTKTFGTIRKGEENDYLDGLYTLELNLVRLSRVSGNKNGRRIIEAIKICLLTIDGYLNDYEYDLSNYLSDENEDIVLVLLTTFDPFKNEELKKDLEKQINFDSKDSLREYFTKPIKCLLRIEASVDQWTKDSGVHGYIDFLENHMGHTIPYD